MMCIVCVFYVAVTVDVFVVVVFVVFSCLGEGREKLLVIVVLSWRGCFVCTNVFHETMATDVIMFCCS